MKNEENFGYYPEDLVFDEKSQSFKIKNNETLQKNEEKLQNNQNNIQNSVNNIFSQNLISNLLGNNEMLSNLLKGGFKAGDLKSNLLMQALNFAKNKSSKKQSDNKEKTIIDLDDCFEEI